MVFARSTHTRRFPALLQGSSLLALLALGACAEESDFDSALSNPEAWNPTPEDPDALRAGFTLSITTTLEPGETSRFVAQGAQPGERVFMAYAVQGLGNGPCPPQLGGLCIDVNNPKTLGPVTADADGVAVFSLAVPPNAPPGAVLASQAVIVRGPGGADSIKSNARLDTVSAIDRTRPTQGTALALTESGLRSVQANPTANEITVMSVTLDPVNPTGALTATLPVPGGQPTAVVIGSDDNTAFVVLRESGELVRVRNVHNNPTLDPIRTDLDAEPVGLAISPSGTRLYVSHWTAGTVSVVDAQSMALVEVVDLNQSLVDSGLLGPSVAFSRPGLARPWAIVVTDDGDDDDDDEWVYVTDFFSQDDPTKDFAQLGDAYFDEGRQGVVYAFRTSDHSLRPAATLGSIADTGFRDSLGGITGCFPNQLSAIASDNNRIYVASTCTSPRGPAVGGGVNSKTKVHGLISVIDRTTGDEIPAERVLLTREFQDLYDAALTPDDSSRRFPLLPNTLVFFPNSHIAYLTAYGADALFRVEYDASGGLIEVGSQFAKFVNLAGTSPPGRLPIGLALSDTGHALVLNESTRNVSYVLLGTQLAVGTAPAATPVAPGLDTEINDGKRFFVTGLGRWSLNGQAWNSCEGCHPSGLTDNITWFFAAGPRQTVSLDASYGPGLEHRVFNWTGIIDEMHDFENNTRGVSGGVGALVSSATQPISNAQRIIFDGTKPPGFFATNTSQVNLNGAVSELLTIGIAGVDNTGAPTTVLSVLDDWDRIDAYSATIRSPTAPDLDPADVAAGRNLFLSNGCNGCHGGVDWTIGERFYVPDQVVSGVGGLLETTTYSIGNLPPHLNPPAQPTGTAFLKGNGNIQCVLRAVGTFGVGAPDVVVSERREDMVTVATGTNGYNPPSLVGAALGAPYFHAGNARSLEEIFDPTFEPHYRALSSVFSPTQQQIRQLGAFLLSIDDAKATENTDVGQIDTILCPSVFP